MDSCLKQYILLNFQTKCLKGQCHKIFDSRFFHEFNPSGLVMLNYFCRWGFNFAEIFTYAKNSAVSLKPVSQTLYDAANAKKGGRGKIS